jgi:hypothetical protein
MYFLIQIFRGVLSRMQHEHSLAGNCVIDKRGWRAVCGGLKSGLAAEGKSAVKDRKKGSR